MTRRSAGAFALSALLSLSVIAGCGSDDEDSTTEDPAPVEEGTTEENDTEDEIEGDELDDDATQ